MPNTGYERHIEKLRVQIGASYVTQREAEVLRAYVEGERTQQIAARLRISNRTIDGLMRRAKERLQVSSLCELVAKFVKAIEQGRGPQTRSLGQRVDYML